MIGWLAGTVREFDPAGAVLLDVGGVGYDVMVSMQTLCTLEHGTQAELFIHTHVREDQLMLFGFASQRERAVFRQLTNVSGIGARMGMNILSSMSVQDLLCAIDSADDAAIARTPGIGKKTAQRLILELKGKLSGDASGKPAAAVHSVAADVRSALANQGYKPAQIDA
ncbi:MAG: Holliday junction branch migration protein RuvA, partial [Mariprofundaceae bacterium]|nr:Holliday junction branch migration protein RuvA [Mariprofundaceae bacterium]